LYLIRAPPRPPPFPYTTLFRSHLVIDPLLVGAEIVSALQTIVARSADPSHGVVVSCTEFTTDGARNAIPGVAVIRGDARTFTEEDRKSTRLNSSHVKISYAVFC